MAAWQPGNHSDTLHPKQDEMQRYKSAGQAKLVMNSLWQIAVPAKSKSWMHTQTSICTQTHTGTHTHICTCLAACTFYSIIKLFMRRHWRVTLRLTRCPLPDWAYISLSHDPLPLSFPLCIFSACILQPLIQAFSHLFSHLSMRPFCQLSDRPLI